MKTRLFLILILPFLLAPGLLRAQTDAAEVRSILSHPIEPREVVTFQLQEFLLNRAPKLSVPPSADAWTEEASQIRERLLHVIFHGWPEAWVSAAPQFQDMGQVPTGSSSGYVLHKLRYEVVPGFYATALLYEPAHLTSKSPAILDVMGHFPVQGKAEEFQQKLCINQALHGIIALNLEWIGMGELNVPSNSHWNAAGLELTGASGAGLFYLAMRKGLDYLWSDPAVDRSRIGVTGLSGGGWQTIVLSGLDPRVKASVPIAGFTTLPGRVVRLPGEPGDFEQNASDLLVGQDYSALVAMRAPRPTLIIDNVNDNCCFRAPLVKPAVYDAIKPIFALYGKPDNLEFYASASIDAHNEGLENRERAERFFARQFGLPDPAHEIPVGEDLKTYSELKVGTFDGNLTILALARKMASQIARQPAPAGAEQRASWAASERRLLTSVVRYRPVEISQAWREANTLHNQVESLSYRFVMDNSLPATGVWMKDVSSPSASELTIELNDAGTEAAAKEAWDRLPEIADRLERGDQVLALNLVFTGDASPEHPELMAEMLAATGERPLGIEAAQLAALARWARDKYRPARVRIEADGIRSQVAALVAAALNPGLFEAIEIHHGMSSLAYLIDAPVPYQRAPDLFCLDLFRDFDIDSLSMLASPAAVVEKDQVSYPQER